MSTGIPSVDERRSICVRVVELDGKNAKRGTAEDASLTVFPIFPHTEQKNLYKT